MTISYSEFQRRRNIIEPNLTKSRLIYKGPVSSGLLNLSNDQLLLDLNRLKLGIDRLNQNIAQISQMTGNDLYAATPDYYTDEDLKMTIYSQSIRYDESSESYEVTQSTPSYLSDLTFEKFHINSAKISWLSQKLNIIEDAMKKDI